MFELSKAVVNELPDPAVYNHPPGVEQLVTRPVVEQLVRGRHYGILPNKLSRFAGRTFSLKKEQQDNYKPKSGLGRN